MEYKLLRALSIVLQAGLVILLTMLLSLLFFSCKPTPKHSTVNSRFTPEVKKEIMEQRFFNELQKKRLNMKTLCLEKQALALHMSI
jgi:hypothetical protein